MNREEAIQILETQFPHDSVIREALATVIPEFRERIEDERMLNSVIRIITQFDDLAHEPTYAGPKWTHPYTKEIAWLKSIRPQPKQEVTDEEIEEMVTKRSRSSGTTKSEMAFYRNGIKDAIKRFGLRPSWKPSEEHLSALLAIFNDPDNIGSQTCQLALSDLYEQLKKL